jgi:hypothetical protein
MNIVNTTKTVPLKMVKMVSLCFAFTPTIKVFLKREIVRQKMCPLNEKEFQKPIEMISSVKAPS